MVDRASQPDYKPALPSPPWAGSAQVAQLVEHATENRSVGGSIPPLGTICIARQDRNRVHGAMSRKNRTPLADRVAKAAETTLAAHQYVSAIDVLLLIGWLDGSTVERWRRAQIDCLEGAVQIGLPRMLEALKLLQAWATGRGLSASPADYVARNPQRQTLRFSRSGDPAIEALYRTHWVSQQLSDKKRERLADKASRAPDLVVVQPLKHEWTCHRCGGTGDFLMMENPGPACLSCVGLDDLEFLPAGDALLSRRVKAKSTRYAVVVRFSRSRRRYERQGLLVEPPALADVQRELETRRGG
ncbi:MAG: hypothetical protein JWP51_3613 [Bradyrhizobium sp.]|nr:hypothetical protein [Bradyrhizobium sp.]